MNQNWDVFVSYLNTVNFVYFVFVFKCFLCQAFVFCISNTFVTVGVHTAHSGNFYCLFSVIFSS